MKKKASILLLFCFFIAMQQSMAQDAKAIIRLAYKNFAPISDYSCKTFINFDIPGLNIEHIDGMIFYKKPSKFRVRCNGIVFLPKQNPNQILSIISDTLSFMPVFMGKETVNAISCDIVQLIPLKDQDIVAAKIYIDSKGLVQKAQITSKENGTANVINTFDASSKYGMPAKTMITFDMKKFKVPKMVSVDINSKSPIKTAGPLKTTGSVTLTFSAYKFNQKLSDTVFTEKD